MSLIVSDIHKRFGRVSVLRGVTFECVGGELLAIVGENGCGKSTLLAILAGLLVSDGGAAELDGESLLGRRPRGRSRLGFVPEKANPPPRMTGRQLLALVESLKGSSTSGSDEQTALGIDHLLSRPIGGLSLGQRRRLCLAAALIGKPSLLLLDEPTNGLDNDGVAMLVKLLRANAERGVAIVVATHDQSFIAATDAKTKKLKAGVLAPAFAPPDGDEQK